MKFAAYGLMPELGATLAPLGSMHILGAARFIIRRALKRAEGADSEALKLAFADFIEGVNELEPTEDEIALATEIEEFANRSLLEFDAGESQLCAIAIIRAMDAVITGDKRAIQAAEAVSESIAELSSLFGKLVCLEQLMIGVITAFGDDNIRPQVCASKAVDTALSICFKCWSPEIADKESIRLALQSYIESLRSDAPRLLYTGIAFPSS
ncbi:hypothetical protein EB75_24955 [Mycobacterium sp. ST-F2]|uniref:hypothetical protein n=1 Tax=Mycobacterium sp. ST-F2 TaxID=1490484 RepID=UPI00093F6EF0|nr:hypothetical protein [Mycobacterium sp. ST-F2]OKH79339.1 hypothetical protein EB75_24955 [Mycobacterium sp. ST-F2]